MRWLRKANDETSFPGKLSLDESAKPASGAFRTFLLSSDVEIRRYSVDSGNDLINIQD